jgi:hypothetical protein
VKFLITGYPRSGTYYIAKVLNTLGNKVGHEFVDKDGCVSWGHLPKADEFDTVIHQVRNPLKVIGSCFTISEGSYKKLEKLTPRLKNESKLSWLMRSWLDWTDKADEVAEYTYRVENLEETYPHLFNLLGLEVPEKLPDISKNTHSRSHIESYRNFTMDNFINETKRTSKKIAGKMYKYGY